MRDEEFNYIEIKNEREGFSSFEFGRTQNNESTSFSDNKNNIHDEVNDNPTSNSPHKNAEQKRRKQDEDELREQLNRSSSEGSESGSSSSSSSASGSSAASGGAAASSSAAASASTAASVVGATVVAVGAVAAAVGINVFAECKMNALEATYDSINYDLEISGISDSKYSITIRGVENVLLSYHDLEEGVNTGEFTDLNSDTEYTLSVVDSSNLDLTVNDWTWTKNTLKKDEPVPPGPVVETVTVSFDANGGTGTMSDVTVNKGEEYTLPECSYKYDGHSFSYWTIGDEEVGHEAGTKITVDSDITLKARWDVKFCAITFNANNGTGETKDPIVLPYGTSYSLPENPFSDPDEHQMFKGWKINGRGPVVQYTWTVKVDTVLDAVWQDAYKITYYSNTEYDETYVDKLPTSESLYTTLSSDDNPFTPPEGLVIDYWEVGDEQIQPGGWVAINSDTDINTVWKEAEYMVWYQAFDVEGHVSGETEPLYATRGSYDLLDYLPDDFQIDEGYQLVGWEINGDTYDLGETIDLDSDINVYTIIEEMPLTINDLVIKSIDANSGTMTLQVDYAGSPKDIDSFALKIFRFDPADELIIRANVTTSEQTIDSIDFSTLDFNNPLHSYQFGYYNDQDDLVVLDVGSVNIAELRSDKAYLSFTNNSEGSPAFWNNESSYSSTAVNVQYNSNSQYTSFKVGYTDPDNQYKEVIVPSSTTGSQTIILDSQFGGSGSVTLTNLRLISGDDVTLQVIDSITLTESTTQTINGAHFHNEVIPSDKAEASNFRMNFFGKSITSLPTQQVTLGFTFYDGISNTPIGTYSERFYVNQSGGTASEGGWDYGYVYFNLGNLDNTSGGGYTGFVDMAKRYVCDVTLSYRPTSGSDLVSTTLYTKHSFSII